MPDVPKIWDSSILSSPKSPTMMSTSDFEESETPKLHHPIFDPKPSPCAEDVEAKSNCTSFPKALKQMLLHIGMGEINLLSVVFILQIWRVAVHRKQREKPMLS